MTIIIVTAAEWAPERRAGLARLQSQLPHAVTLASPVREHASTWAVRAWRRAAAHEGPTVILNDDVTVCPDFPAVVEAMCSAVPNEVIALHTTHPIAPSLAMCGERWLRSYWLTGPGYILPAGAAQRLLAWVARAPRQLIASINEDNMAMHWAWSEQRPIWHCIPALVQHDVSVPSTLGYDEHPGRQTNVPWDAPGMGMWNGGMLPALTEYDFWRGEPFRHDLECGHCGMATDNPDDLPLLVECPWMPTLQLARIERAFHDRPELCCLCHARDGGLTAGSGARVCGKCVVNCVGALANLAESRMAEGR